MDFLNMLTTLPGLAVATTLLSVFFVTKIPSGTDVFGLIQAKQLVSWIVAIALVFAASFFDLSPFLAEETTFGLLINGVGVGLIANGVKDVAFVTKGINFVTSKFKK